MLTNMLWHRLEQKHPMQTTSEQTQAAATAMMTIATFAERTAKTEPVSSFN